ncbi:YveK family protein [Planococcus chinensis]|uniref:YveK family protein n=1 Tax=Planococcus chinensis TaxID=272917 RepID=A0ABW4QEK7_9BACL
MEETLELKEIYRLLRKRAGLIFLMIVASAGLAAILSFYIMSPMYEGTTQILVSQGAAERQGLTENDVQADLQLVNTYRGLIESPVIMGKVIEQLDLDITVNDLKKNFTINSSSESQLIEIAVADQSQRQAVDIANATAAIFQDEVQNIMNANNVKILFPAEVIENTDPISPRPLFNIAVGAALGLIIGIVLAFLLSYLDTSIKSERDIEKYLNVPVLAVISHATGSLKDSEAAKVVLKEKEA